MLCSSLRKCGCEGDCVMVVHVTVCCSIKTSQYSFSTTCGPNVTALVIPVLEVLVCANQNTDLHVMLFLCFAGPERKDTSPAISKLIEVIVLLTGTCPIALHVILSELVASIKRSLL